LFSGTVTPGDAATTESGGRLTVNDAFELIDNQWGNPDAEQSVWVETDGRYGWEFDATGTDSGINYPEVLIGTKPWGTDTGTSAFPIRRSDIDQFVLDIHAESVISGGEWDWAQEWWLLEEPPDVETATHQYEVMLLLDWGGGHDHGTPVYTDLWTDEFGNTIDLWALYDSGGTDAPFYIFRVQGGHDGGKIDVARIVEWLTEHENVDQSLLISGSELGNEYWPGAVGQTSLDTFDVTLNGETYRSGGIHPPATLSSPTHDSAAVALDWDGVSYVPGSELDSYSVYIDGSVDHQVGPETTSTTVSGLAPATTHEFRVTAVDAAGNESRPSPGVSVTTDSSDSDITSGAVYRLENQASGKVLDVEGWSTGDGGNVHQWSWTGGTNQRWVLRSNGDGTYRLENDHSGKVLDVEGWSTEDGGNIHQWSWTGGANQRWVLRSNGDGTHRLENDHSGKVLDVEGWSTDDGGNVHQWSWTGGANQRWVLTDQS
jgi:hypothetical protein